MSITLISLSGSQRSSVNSSRNSFRMILDRKDEHILRQYCASGQRSVALVRKAKRTPLPSQHNENALFGLGSIRLPHTIESHAQDAIGLAELLAPTWRDCLRVSPLLDIPLTTVASSAVPFKCLEHSMVIRPLFSRFHPAVWLMLVSGTLITSFPPLVHTQPAQSQRPVSTRTRFYSPGSLRYLARG